MSQIKLFIFFIILFTGFNAAAQVEETVPLKQVFFELERRFSIVFTFADENISGRSIKSPPTDITLEEALEYLHQNTSLIFTRLNERFIAVQKEEAVGVDICGYLKDAITSQPLNNVVISIADRYTVSDQHGYFILRDLPQDSSVTVQAVNYNRKRLEINEFLNSGCQDIIMDPLIITLPEVVVKNYLTTGINKQIGGIIIIKTDQLGILPGLIEPDVLQTIQTLPGIQSLNETVSDINVRGGTNDQNLVIWNGIRMYQTGHFFGLISAFNPYLTDDVVLVKNGTSATLGGGVSSSILIKTDDRVVQKFSGAAGINMLYGDVLAKIPLSSKASVQISSRRSYTDWMESPTYDQYFERIFTNTEVANSNNQVDQVLETDEDFYFYDVSAKFLYDISDKDKLRINFLNIYNDIRYQESAVINKSVESKTSGLDQHSLASGIYFSRLWRNDFKTTAQINLSSYQLDAVNFDILNNQRLLQGNEVLDLGLKIDSRISISNKFDLSNGYEFSEIGVTNYEDVNNPEFSRLIKEVVRTHAGFLEGNYSSDSENTNIQGGVRLNYYEKPDFFIIEPRFAINQRIHQHFNIEVLGEVKSQALSQVIDFQNDFLGVEKRRWVLSNDTDIPVIKSRQLSIGFNYVRKNFLINLEGYHKDVKGIISSSQGFQNQFQYIRTAGDYATSGFDFLINKKFTKINTWLSYSFANSNYYFLALEPSEFPNNLDIRHIMTFGSSYQYKGFQFSLGLNWHSGKPFTEAVGAEGQIIYSSPNLSRLNDYLRIDASAKYDFHIRKNVNGQIGLSVWNLPDHENVINSYYKIASGNQLKRINEYSLGITPNAFLRISF